VRNISYIIIGADKNKINKTGVLTGRAFNESAIGNKATIREKETTIDAMSFIEI